MRVMLLLGAIFLVLGLLAVGTGGGFAYMGAETADNQCGSNAVRDCEGRDARSAEFSTTGRTFILGGFGLMGGSLLLFLAPSFARTAGTMHADDA